MPATRPPNVLLFGFRRPLNQEALRRALDAVPVGKVGLISRDNFLGQRASYFLPARNGFRDCTFDTNPFKAFPPASFIRAQQPSEVVVLRMFERIFRRVRTGLSLELRKRLYLEQLAYAYGLIVDGGYDTVILSDIPHNPFSYLIYSVARGLGLNVFFLLQLQVKDTFIVARSVEDMFAPTRAEYRRLEQSGEPVTLSPRMQAEFDRRSGKHEPFYMNLQGLSWMTKLYEVLRRNTRTDEGLRILRTVRNAVGYWRALKPAPPEGTSFVYFPLHLQPEATTSPMGGVFVDQHLAIEMLARALPDGWCVVVKENPVQPFAKRDLGFYERLRRMSNVRLVSRKTSTFTLIERCRAVATITGTAGWEALFLGKPAIAFGYAFYSGAPGCITVDDPADLAARLREIQDGSFPVATPEGLRRFLAALDRTSFEGIVDKAYLRDTAMPESASIESYAAVLARLLQRPETIP